MLKTLYIVEATQGVFGKPETMRSCFLVMRPFSFAGQDIGELVAQFDTFKEAEDYINA